MHTFAFCPIREREHELLDEATRAQAERAAADRALARIRRDAATRARFEAEAKARAAARFAKTQEG